MANKSSNLQPEDQVKINSIATHWFRDQADQDYITARMCFRAKLVGNFHWSSLQALEKYFKAIFLYNRIQVPKFKHKLSTALSALSGLPFKLELTASTEEFIKHIDSVGNNRYLERPYFTLGMKLLELDHAIWEVRRFCRVLNSNYTDEPIGKQEELTHELERVQSANRFDISSTKLRGGWLEKVLDDKNHPAREYLIWQNPVFSSRRRSSVMAIAYMQFKNPPHYFFPEAVDLVQRYVYVPPGLVKACHEMSKRLEVNHL